MIDWLDSVFTPFFLQYFSHVNNTEWRQELGGVTINLSDRSMYCLWYSGYLWGQTFKQTLQNRCHIVQFKFKQDIYKMFKIRQNFVFTATQ